MNRILVTGSLGTVGRPLVRELRQRGHSVAGCDLSHAETERGFLLKDGPHREVQYLRCDVGEFRQTERVMEEVLPDIVYHLAAEFGRWNGEDFYEQLWRTNVIGTKNILRLQERLCFRLIHFSSSEVYGDWVGLMEESVPSAHPIAQMNDYAMTKWVNEQQIGNSIRQYNTQSVIVRLFNTYGPGEHYSPYRSVNCRFLYCALRGWGWTVHAGHSRTSTYIDDTVRTLANVADRFSPGEVYNIAGSRRHTIEELSDIVVRVTGCRPELARRKDSEPMTTRQKMVDNSKSVRDLDHQSTVELEEGMTRTAEWMRQVYNL